MVHKKRGFFQICFLIFLVALCSCKKDKPAVKPVEAPALESYMQIGDEYYALTNALVAQQKKGDTTVFQIGFANFHDDNFLVVEYLIAKNTSVLKDGNYEFAKSENLQNLAEQKFHNAFLKYGKYQEKVLLDGLASNEISQGNLKIETKSSGKKFLNLTLTIDSKKVKVYYEGPIKYEEFSW